MRGLLRLLALIAVLALIFNVLGCGGGEEAAIPTTTPTPTPEEGVGEETPVVGYLIAEANELRTELDTYSSIAMDTGIEIAQYCDTFWETWRDGTKEEMLQLAADHPLMATRVAQAEAELDSALDTIHAAQRLNIPAWYQDYFSKKEQVAGYLATALQLAEGFLAAVEPMVENMSDYISAAEGIMNFWDEVVPEIGSLIDQDKYSEAQQRLVTVSASIDDMENIFTSAYEQAGVPALQWFHDRCSSLGEAITLVDGWLEAKQAGNAAQAEQLKSEIRDLVFEELEILESIPWEESNTWFETNFGSLIDQVVASLEQAVPLNAEAELAYEAHWTPTAEELEQIYCVAASDPAGDVQEYYDPTRYPERDAVTVGGHSETDLTGAHTRVQGDNVIFWLEVPGDIIDDPDVSYEFSGYTQPDYEGYMRIGYCSGEAEHYISETAGGGYEFIPCQYSRSGGALMIIVPKNGFGTPALWDFELKTVDLRSWTEEGKGYYDAISLTK